MEHATGGATALVMQVTLRDDSERYMSIQQFQRLSAALSAPGFCKTPFRRFRKNQDALPHQHSAHGRGDRMRCCGSLIGILGTWRSLLLVIISRRLRDPPLSPNENPRSKPRPGRRGCAGTLGSFVTRKQPSRRDI